MALKRAWYSTAANQMKNHLTLNSASNVKSLVILQAILKTNWDVYDVQAKTL